MKKINENIGNGFAMNATFATSSGRGGILNKLKPYDYSIKPLNHSLEVKPSIKDNNENISVGNVITGKEFSGKNYIIGRIISVKNNELGNIYIVLDKDNKKHELDPSTVSKYNKNLNTGFNNMNKDIYRYKAKKVQDIL